jgi:hypothetical protein
MSTAKKNFFEEFSQQILLGVGTALVLAVITFGVTQIGKIDGLERTMRELPSADTEKLTKVIEELQDTSAKTEARLKILLLTLKAKGVFTDEEVRTILDR